MSSESYNPIVNSSEDPQMIGLIHPEDHAKALTDHRTIFIETAGRAVVPVLVPVDINSEVNQHYFEDSPSSYYFNWEEMDLSSGSEIEKLTEVIAHFPIGSKILLEHRSDNQQPLNILVQALNANGRHLDIDPKSVDEKTGTAPAVLHFFSPLYKSLPNDAVTTYDQAYEYMQANGTWSKFETENVNYVRGEDVTPELMQELWDVYDQTFDDLVINHPMAQKQTKEDFYTQTMSSGSKVVYAVADSKIASAIFLMEDATELSWLNPEFFHSRSMGGKTVYIPAISTRLDMTGLTFSEKIIGGISALGQQASEIRGFATQCTNRSVTYIPSLAEKFTEGTVNLDLENTATYLSPVLVVS